MSAHPPGVLVLVVGPSGVGKDTLIAGAKTALKADKRFSFVQRSVTRTSDVDAEDHITLTPEEFADQDRRGRFAITWQAHNLDYGLPIGLDTDLMLGRVVVANISRHAVSLALAKYKYCRVIQVSAEISVRAERLAKRGRESRDQIITRLARVGAEFPTDIKPIVIDNSNSVGVGIHAFVMALRSIAEG